MPKPSKTIGKTKKTKKNKTFGPMSPKRVIGPKVVFLLCCLVFPMVFDGFGIDLFGCFGFVWFSQWFLTFSNLHMIHPEGSELDAVFVQYVNTIILHKNNCSALRQIVVSLARNDNYQNVQQKTTCLCKNEMYKYVFRLHGKHVLKVVCWPRRNTYS